LVSIPESLSFAVTADHLEWEPIGNQATVFADNPLTPLHEDVPLPLEVKGVNTSLVLAKLKPGQRLQLEAYAFKGKAIYS
jgi:hypothetical protein